jgi:23S rRNA (adenine2503-C2)-methyltransferase
MLAGVNDSPALARALVKLVHGLDCHINLIPMNPVAELPYAPSSDDAVQTFHQTLRQAGLIATIRREMGRDIQAACGQLQTAVRRQPLVQEHSP